MTLRMNGIVRFERDAEGRPIEGTDWFDAYHNRDDYRPLECTHVRPQHRTHIERIEFADGSFTEHRTHYVELEPVTTRVRTQLAEHSKYHHAFPRATKEEWLGAHILAAAAREKRAFPEAA